MEQRRVLDAAAGFGGVERARRQGPEWLRAEVAVAGIRGRGGAAFPLWTKWDAALTQPGPRVVVVNGAEDEPGSLKDRYLLATRPEIVLDGALCTAMALGADRIVLYINEEADGPLRSAAAAVDRASAAGLCTVAPTRPSNGATGETADPAAHAGETAAPPPRAGDNVVAA
ncbi:MAG TPA: hypothetical protein VGR20_24415, partial [Acidimicrobiia bacterium]|nr:hypothetical protein [Acidimicrobiia bacterium]